MQPYTKLKHRLPLQALRHSEGSIKHLIHYAAQNGWYEITDILIRQLNLNVNLHNKEQITPLHCAVSARKQDIVRLLLRRHGVDVNEPSGLRWHPLTPLSTAARAGDEGIVRDLINRQSIEVNARCGVYFETALHHGTTPSIVLVLINVPGIDISCKSTRGFTPLHSATMRIKEKSSPHSGSIAGS